MNVEIGAEAAQFPEKEYINGIAFVVRPRETRYSGTRGVGGGERMGRATKFENYINNPLFSFTHSWKNPNLKNKKVGKNKKTCNKKYCKCACSFTMFSM
jgi:hypothetical protein